MKYLAVLLFCVIPASAQTVIQHKGCTSGAAATSVTCAFATNPGAGHDLIYITAAAESGTLGAATDNNSNTISKAIDCGDVSNPCNTGGGADCRIDYVANSNAGATTATAHQTTANSAIFLWIAEVSGMVTVSPLDQTGSALSATQSVSTSSADSNANDLVVALAFDLTNNATLAAGTGYSGDLIANSTDGDAAFGEFKSATSATTQTATWTGNGTDVTAQCIATLKASAAAANAPTQIGGFLVGP